MFYDMCHDKTFKSVDMVLCIEPKIFFQLEARLMNVKNKRTIGTLL